MKSCLWMVLVIVLVLRSGVFAFEFKNGTYILTVVKVMDENLPILSDEEANEILLEAQRIIEYKLNQRVTFKYAGQQSVSDFFGSMEQNKEFLQVAKAFHKIDIFDGIEMQSEKIDKDKAVILRDLKYNLALSEIDSFFGVHIGSYEKAFKIIRSKYLEARQALIDIHVDNKSPYFKKSNPDFWLFSRWFAALGVMDDFDIVITNVPIVPDGRLAMNGGLPVAAGQGVSFSVSTCQGSVVSTFLMDVDHPFFNKFKSGLTKEEKNLVMGEIVAKGIGFYLYSIRTVYLKEDRGCLMQKDSETLYNKKGLTLLNQRGPCKEEIAEAKLTEFLDYWDDKKKTEALKILKEVESHYFPERYAGLYRLAYIYYALLNRTQDAKKIYRKVQKLPIPKQEKKEFWTLLKEAKEEIKKQKGGGK